MRNLKKRLQLIRLMELLAVISFVLCVASMFLLLNALEAVAIGVFGTALLVLMLSLFAALYEIHISAQALEILLAKVEAPGNGG
jgi:hypothetical protein